MNLIEPNVTLINFQKIKTQEYIEDLILTESRNLTNLELETLEYLYCGIFA